MGDKQELLSEAIPDLIGRLVTPKCIDAFGNILGDSNAGTCTQGTLEFKPVPDIHIAIVTSSLGGLGSDVCPDDAPNPIHPELLRLRQRSRLAFDQPFEQRRRAAPFLRAFRIFLAWFPNVDANARKSAADRAGDPTGSGTRSSTSFQSLVAGVGEYGCGFEAHSGKLVSGAVQPDPYGKVRRRPMA